MHAVSKKRAEQDGSGYLYVLSNESMPGIVKVGMSKRTGSSRADELYRGATGVPTPFVLEFEIFTDHVIDAEIEAHSNLDHFRVTKAREFFRVSVNVAVREVSRIALQQYSDLNISDDYHYFDPFDAQMLCQRSGLSWEDVTCAIGDMTGDEVIALHKKFLERTLNIYRHHYGENHYMTQGVYSKLCELADQEDDGTTEVTDG